jgi:CRP-like cAMP-binding protein
LALQDDVRNLASNPTLRAIEPEALRLIAFSAETQFLRVGDILFRRGEVSDGGYVVLMGAVALGADEKPVAIARAPALIGDSALITRTVRPCMALAIEPSTVLKIPRALFRRVLSEHPDSAARLRRTLAHRLFALRNDLSTYRGELL